jgi:hypothetical protein
MSQAQTQIGIQDEASHLGGNNGTVLIALRCCRQKGMLLSKGPARIYMVQHLLS